MTLAATVAFFSGVVVSSGQVNFCDATAAHCTDIHLLGTAQLNSVGVATLKFVPGPGAHSYKAVFLGTATSTTVTGTSVSSTSTLTVNAPTGPVKTTVGIQAAGGQGDYTLLGTVASNGPASPSGTISFLDTTNANYVLGSATLGPTGPDGISFLSTFDYPTPITANLQGSGRYQSGNFSGDSVVTADFNGDGIPDILLANAGNNIITVLLGNGDGTFTAKPVPNPSGFTPSYAAVGDFNADGKADFAVTNNIQEGVSIYLGNGDGTFTPGQVLPSLHDGVSTAIQMADFNGDGIPDLIDAVAETTPAYAAFLLVYLGNGDGTFHAVPVRSALNGQDEVLYMVVADFNNDGLPDVATTRYGIAVLIGNGDGTFTAAPAPPLSPIYREVEGLATADLNQDGKADLVATSLATLPGNAPTVVLLGNGDGTFNILAADPNLAKFANQAALADFNGDGIPDLILPDISGGTTDVFLGRGDGTFIPDAFSPGTANYVAYSIATGDFNGDGQSDIAALYVDATGYNTPPNDYLGVLLAQSPSTSAGYLYSVSPVGTGYHYVDASYIGDSNNAPGISSTIPLLAERVTTAIALTVSTTTAYPGQPVTLTATLNPFLAQNHYAGATINFLALGKSVGIPPIVNGVATVTVTTLPIGTDSITAVYYGDTNFTSIISHNMLVTVAQAATTMTLTSSSNPAYVGQPVTLTAQLTVNGQPVPAGTTITLSQALLPTGLSKVLATLTTDATGTATYTTSFAAAGSYYLSAGFAGTAGLQSSSANLIEVIQPSTFTIALQPATITLGPGQVGSTQVALTSVGNFNGPLTLSYGALPQYATATISPSSVVLSAGGTGSATLVLKTLLTAAADTPPRPGAGALPAVLSAVMVILLPLCGARRRRLRQGLCMLVAGVLLLTSVGCTNAYYVAKHVAPGTYLVPVTATDIHGNSQSATLTLMVTP